jgi:hypothetical protein
MGESLQEIISRLWTTPEHAEWIPKTDVVALSDLQTWMHSTDIEILGFTHALLSDRRFRIEPPISLGDYIEFTQRYYERCLKENPDGDWSDSRYSAGTDLVNIFVGLWKDPSVPRPVLAQLKVWLGQLYKDGDAEIRTCIVQATLEHLFEQKDVRKFFSDWQNDAVLAKAYAEASEWYQGGGRTPLGRPPFVQK